MMTKVVVVALLLLVGCGGGASSPSDGGGTGGGGTGSGGTGGAGTGGASPGTGGSAAYCPTGTAPSQTSVTYSGDTTGKPDLLQTKYIEFRSEPDDAILFVAPQAGTYAVSLPVHPQTNGGCQVTWGRGTELFTPASACPAMGQFRDYMADALMFTNETPVNVTLTANQQVLFFVSCTYWSTPQKMGPYQLKIEKQ